MQIKVKVDREVFLNLERNSEKVQECLNEIAHNLALDAQFDAMEHMLDYGFSHEEAGILMEVFQPSDDETYQFEVVK